MLGLDGDHHTGVRLVLVDLAHHCDVCRRLGRAEHSCRLGLVLPSVDVHDLTTGHDAPLPELRVTADIRRFDESTNHEHAVGRLARGEQCELRRTIVVLVLRAGERVGRHVQFSTEHALGGLTLRDGLCESCVTEAGILRRVGGLFDLVDEEVLADDRPTNVVRPTDEQLAELRFDDAGVEGFRSHLNCVIEAHTGDSLSHLDVEQCTDGTGAIVEDGFQAKVELTVNVTMLGAAPVLNNARAVCVWAALDEARTVIQANERRRGANRPVRGFDSFLGLRDAARLVERDGVLALVLVRDRRGDVVGDALLEGRERVGVLRPDNELHLSRLVSNETDLPHGLGVRLPEVDDLRPNVHPFFLAEFGDVLEGYPVEAPGTTGPVAEAGNRSDPVREVAGFRGRGR
ncbi:MAG: hypothetical protein J07HQW2_00056 [Haloquadratum walsbyi J07HQW2]|uniref:Uncharacterized protein n=1 Tax=Haloquadratum walsbyi J07HQW2 TaxID=1238425 RepID=U1NAJ0_9EURY|nr:MAG: hypothetical protein J07HQW2_00056 [Haloquadratum walsbyi J07HQW2]